MSDSIETDERQLLGRGSFGTVYSIPGLPFAFKFIQRAEDAEILKHEYQALHSLYTHCDIEDSIFVVPRPVGYFNPVDGELVAYTGPGPGSETASWVRRRRDPRGGGGVDGSFFDEVLSCEDDDKKKEEGLAVYAMDRAFKLPKSIGMFIKQHFYPPNARTTPVCVPVPILCRLYFGKQIDVGRQSSFVNPHNFILDVNRYGLLYDNANLRGAMHPIDVVAEGMGEMLAWIHWRCGYDGRDIEFVLGGSSVAGATRCYVIDFNQMRHDTSIKTLLSAFFDNDPYYPRPVPSDPLYVAFRKGYVDACPEDHSADGEKFLAAIEEKYANRG